MSEPACRDTSQTTLGPLTRLLCAWSAGNEEAGRELIERVYPKLRGLAANVLRSHHPSRIQLTELVSETYLRLRNVQHYEWENHSQFLAVAAMLVRQVLVDAARRHNSEKRGGQKEFVEFHEGLALSQERSTADILAIDQALTKLELKDPIASKLVELRYFCGLSIDEAAKSLNLGRTTTVKMWAYAKASLRWELRGADS